MWSKVGNVIQGPHVIQGSQKEVPVNSIKGFLLIKNQYSSWKIIFIDVMNHIPQQSEMFADVVTLNTASLIGMNNMLQNFKKTTSKSKGTQLVVHIK